MRALSLAAGLLCTLPLPLAGQSSDVDWVTDRIAYVADYLRGLDRPAFVDPDGGRLTIEANIEKIGTAGVIETTLDPAIQHAAAEQHVSGGDQQARQ